LTHFKAPSQKDTEASDPSWRRRLRFGVPAATVLAIASLITATNIPTHSVMGARLHLNHHAKDLLSKEAKTGNGGEAPRGGPATVAQEQYDNLAYPAAAVNPTQQQNAYQSFLSIDRVPGGKKANWQQIGPITPNVPGPVTYTGAPTVNSGRVTSLAISPTCRVGDCKIVLGAAGGGVWIANDALALQPSWRSSSNGIPSNAIGSIAFDPNDPSGQTMYVGTGEPNGSGDSEAGVGLFRSTDGGNSWALVPGSSAVATDRSIGAVAIDPANPNPIFIGTDVARHGSSSENGGRFTPPNAPKVGLYESMDGGATFSLAFSQPSALKAYSIPSSEPT